MEFNEYDNEWEKKQRLEAQVRRLDHCVDMANAWMAAGERITLLLGVYAVVACVYMLASGDKLPPEAGIPAAFLGIAGVICALRGWWWAEQF